MRRDTVKRYRCPNCDDFHRSRMDAAMCCAPYIDEVECIECPECEEYTPAKESKCEHCGCRFDTIEPTRCPVCESERIRIFRAVSRINDYYTCKDCQHQFGPVHSNYSEAAAMFREHARKDWRATV